MKKLLLTTALVAFAGVAHAELTSSPVEDRSNALTFSVAGDSRTAGDSLTEGNLGVNGNTRLGNHSTDRTTVNGELHIADPVNGGSTNVGNAINQNATDIATNASDIVDNDAAIRGIEGRTENFSPTYGGGTTHNGDFTIGTDAHLPDNNGVGTTEGNLTVKGNTTLGNSASDTTTINGDTQLNGGLTIGDQGDHAAGIAGNWETLEVNGQIINNGHLTTSNQTTTGSATFNGITNNRYLEQRGSATFTNGVAITGGLTVDGQQITSGAAGKNGTNGTNGTNGVNGKDGAAGANGRDGRDGTDGQDARINVNSAGQYVVSDSSGKSVTVATDEQVTLTKDELTALIESVAATATANLIAESAELTAEIQAENEARIEAIQAEAEARIEALTVAAEERLAIKTLAVSNTVSIVALEDQWKTCLLYTSPSPRDRQKSRMPSSA